MGKIIVVQNIYNVPRGDIVNVAKKCCFLALNLMLVGNSSKVTRKNTNCWSQKCCTPNIFNVAFVFRGKMLVKNVANYHKILCYEGNSFLNLCLGNK